jgi:hypothetical protein
MLSGLKFNFIGMIFAASIIKLGIYFESFASCPLVEKSVFGLFSQSTYRIGRKIFSDGHRLHHFERKCTLTPNLYSKVAKLKSSSLKNSLRPINWRCV